MFTNITELFMTKSNRDSYNVYKSAKEKIEEAEFLYDVFVGNIERNVSSTCGSYTIKR